MKKLCGVLLLVGLAISAWSAAPAGKTQARLLVAATTARPGETILAGVQLKMPPRWHTYWRNGGDSGAPTKIEWTLPAGVTAGEILWPVPEKFTEPPLTVYVYHDDVVLLVPLTLAATVPAGPLTVKAKVDWLECEKICLPGRATVEVTLTVGPTSQPSNDAALIEQWKSKLPPRAVAGSVRARWEKAADGDSRPLVIEWDTKLDTSTADFFPYRNDAYEVEAKTETISATPGAVQLRKGVQKSEAVWPTEIEGLLLAKPGGGGAAQGVVVTLALGDAVPANAATVPTPAAPGPEKTLFAWLALAFVGGLILNVMPCVLPVIALKILGFVNQGKEDPRTVRRLGLIYALGVLASFLVLAGLVIAVQQAGRKASWGMQFGNPQFLVVLTVLITLVALNLFGLFEVTLSGRAMGAAGNLASREGGAGAFFNGVLATALATPCTAPFLGTALGFAFGQPAWVIVLMFTAVAFGLAAPYVVLCWFPALLKFLPRPGAWMEKFKIAMGFPMLATAVWLFTLTPLHYGKRVLWLGIFLVVIAAAAWVYGEFVQRGRRRRGLALAVMLALLGAGYAYALEGQLRWRDPVKVAGATGSLRESADGIDWQPWSAAAVARAQAEGRPVFVDFTADWCVTCQVNKKSSLEIPSVRAKLKAINAVALLADYTAVPEEMTAELNRFGRAGVPMVLVYGNQPGARPQVLPEVLTPGIVLQALEQAAR